LSSPLSLQGEGLGVRAAATAPAREFQPMTVSLQRVFREDRSPSRNPTTDYGQGITDETQFSLFNPPLDALASLAEEDFHLLFAHSPIQRAKYRGWLRNLCVAMGNSGDRRFVSWLERLSRQADPVVSDHARWALKRM
jgi:epoxyqueuosine reductase